MNRLSSGKREQFLEMLVVGMSMRSASRIAGVSFNTIAKLLVEAGEARAAYHDETIVNVTASRIQRDEIWAFCYAKGKTVRAGLKAMPEGGAGHVWTWTTLDRDTKLVVAYELGDRSAVTANEFIRQLRRRLANRLNSPRTATALTSKPQSTHSAPTWTMPNSSSCTETNRAIRAKSATRLRSASASRSVPFPGIP